MQTYTKNITINHNGESISLPVYIYGVDHEGIHELREYLQDILDQFPKDFLKTYYPLSYITTTHTSGMVTNVMLFHQLRDTETPLELTDTTKEEIIESFYDPNFSWDKPILLQTPSSVIIINQGFY